MNRFRKGIGWRKAAEMARQVLVGRYTEGKRLELSASGFRCGVAGGVLRLRRGTVSRPELVVSGDALYRAERLGCGRVLLSEVDE